MEQILQLVLLILLILVVLLILITGVSSIICKHKACQVNKKLEELRANIIDKIIKEAEEKSEEETQPAIDYNSMTINELKDIAKSRNIKGYYRMKKDELIKALNK